MVRKSNLKLIFDASYPFGCSYQRQMISNLGETEVLSFPATKFFNTFEGGAILSNNDEICEIIRLVVEQAEEVRWNFYKFPLTQLVKLRGDKKIELFSDNQCCSIRLILIYHKRYV